MRISLKTVLGAGVLLCAFLAGVWYSSPKPGPVAASGARVLRYICPMHPQYTSDHPGTAPCCGMRLEPVYADGAGPSGAAAGSMAQVAGTVQLSPQGRQLLGVRVGVAERSSGTESVRLLGRVATDDSRVYRLSASVDGLVREIAAPAAGSIVRKGDLLVRLFSRDVLTPQQGYVYALSARDRMKRESSNTSSEGEPATLQVWTAEQNLMAMGMSEHQIRELEKSRAPQTMLELRAPIDGIVITRNVTLGLRTERNLELYRIADLRRVWVLADVRGREAALIRPGAQARVRFEDRVLPASVSDALPQFDGSTRTLKLRLEMDNPGYVLRPDMFVDVELPVEMPAAVTVPVDAVINSGLRRIVYVDHGDGVFEPRQVETRWQLGDRIAVGRGLEQGERVVVAGTFLVDSESRMKLAAVSARQQQKVAAPKDPVCGMDVDPAKALKVEYRGKTYYFCSESCKTKFQKDPGSYLERKAGETGAGS